MSNELNSEDGIWNKSVFIAHPVHHAVFWQLVVKTWKSINRVYLCHQRPRILVRCRRVRSRLAWKVSHNQNSYNCPYCLRNPHCAIRARGTAVCATETPNLDCIILKPFNYSQLNDIMLVYPRLSREPLPGECLCRSAGVYASVLPGAP